MTTRTVHHIIESMPTSDEADVESPHALPDPFPVLDELSSDDTADYIEIESLLAHVGAGIKATDDR